jgi:hypothetical protein
MRPWFRVPFFPFPLSHAPPAEQRRRDERHLPAITPEPTGLASTGLAHCPVAPGGPNRSEKDGPFGRAAPWVQRQSKGHKEEP